MEESDSLNTSNNSILSIGIEGSPETDLHINVLAAKEYIFFILEIIFFTAKISPVRNHYENAIVVV